MNRAKRGMSQKNRLLSNHQLPKMEQTLKVSVRICNNDKGEMGLGAVLSALL